MTEIDGTDLPDWERRLLTNTAAPAGRQAERWTDRSNPPACVRSVLTTHEGVSGIVDTAGGPATVWLGDYVIPEAEAGKHYPCRPGPFAARRREV